MTSSLKHPPVLILGCGRSGTSIFGELFQGLGPYDYVSEPPFAEMLDFFGDEKAVKVPTESESFPLDPGLSFPMQTLLDKFPATSIFWIVRHPLDAISSLRVGIGRNWSHHPRPPDWKDWLDRPIVEQCAHHWTYINRHGFDRVCNRARLVRFEDMLRSPYEFAANACSQIGLLPSENERHLRIWADRVQDTNNRKFVEAVTSRNHSRPDHAFRVGRWRENLSDEEVNAAFGIVSDTGRRFGYELIDVENILSTR